MVDLVQLANIRAAEVSIALASILVVSGILSRIYGKGKRLPPGPRRFPLIGNPLDLPKDHEWLHWAKLKEVYGPISSVTVLGTTVVILNDIQVAIELFEKRSGIYVNRPSLTFAGKLCGFGGLLMFEQYGDTCKAHRQHANQLLGAHKLVEHHQEHLNNQIRRFIRLIHRSPSQLFDHVRFLAGAITIPMVYGYEVTMKGEDPLVKLAKDTAVGFSDSAVAGRWAVDVLPILQYLPSWFPGAGFRKTAQAYKESVLRFVNLPFSFVKQEMANGSALKSYTSDLLATKETTAEQELFANFSAASLYVGGTGTAASAIQTFFLAMILFPDVQKKAQAEIDALTGSTRLPTLEDRPSLPYIDAVVKETLRWNPVVPMGVPHVPTQDDVFGDFIIPKGSVVLPNIWLFTHDPDNYKRPSEFRPERFFKSNGNVPERDPNEFVFGFGRRLCPGRYLADIELFLVIASSLAVYNIEQQSSQKIEKTKGLFTPSGLINHPEEFACSITPRGKQAEAIIDMLEKYETEDSKHAEKLLLMKTAYDALQSLV